MNSPAHKDALLTGNQDLLGFAVFKPEGSNWYGGAATFSIVIRHILIPRLQVPIRIIVKILKWKLRTDIWILKQIVR